MQIIFFYFVSLFLKFNLEEIKKKEVLNNKFLSKIFLNMLVDLPSSFSLSYTWNFGRMLGMLLIFQIVSGTVLVFYYTPDSILAFNSVQYIILETNFGWLLRIFHFNGASLFFIFVYLHFFKGLVFGRYRLSFVWMSGLLIFIMLIMEAFVGYVLVWAQIRFWAAVVITSLLSVIPMFGGLIVNWVWGGFSVTRATLKFFFVLHFLLPWLLVVLMMVHLVFLHRTGRTSKLYCHGDYDKINFYVFYWRKDGLNIIVWVLFFCFCFLEPFILGDPEIFLEANPMTSPVHIVPEWYFLFAYAILRAIPNKIVGVFFLLFRIVVFLFFLFAQTTLTFLDKSNLFLFFVFLFVGVVLSWLGQCLVEPPYLILSVVFFVLYFSVVFLLLGNNLSVVFVYG